MLEIYDKVEKGIIGRRIEAKAVLLAMDAGKHILLEGPPGTSKSTLVRTIARESNVPLYIVEGSIDLTPSRLVGHYNPTQVMSDTYRPEFFEKGPLTRAMEEGGILYVEEMNRMPAEVANVLISPMEEGDLHIPRYGTVKAVRPFTVIAAQNPYDDVGTVRVSRAFMDRICLIRMDYQSEREEREIVRTRSGLRDRELIAFAVRMTRETRSHSDIKSGASIRAAIDLVELFVKMQEQTDQPAHNMLTAARMAISNKILPVETTSKSAEELIQEIWTGLNGRYEISSDRIEPKTERLEQSDPIEPLKSDQDGDADDSRLPTRIDQNGGGVEFMNFESNDPRDYWQMARFLNHHPEQLETFFAQPGSLEAYARMLSKLQDDVAALATRIASRLIIKIGRNIADTGYRSGKLTLIRGFREGAEIELDRSLEWRAEEPDREIVDTLASHVRHREKQAFVMMLDHSYSMQSKIILAAITAAAIAQHFKRDYAVLAFSGDVSVLKKLEDASAPEKVLEKLLDLQSHGQTNIRSALEAGLRCVSRFDRKTGLLLTDGNWNKGGDPFPAAARFDKLSVIGFPPAEYQKIRQLALQGSGTFALVRDKEEIASAILGCLN